MTDSIKRLVGVCGAPFKCPPAPSEGALMLHDYLVSRGVRDACSISLVIPFGLPFPPSPDSSKANDQAYNGAGSCYIEFGKGNVARVDVDFFSGPKPTGIHHEASEALVTDKAFFGSSRQASWFGR